MRLKAENISKKYFRRTGEANWFYAVEPAKLELEEGTVTVLTGRSGSGKTTLLNMLAGILTPSEGRVFYDDTDIYSLKDRTLSKLRNEKTGVIPQGRSAVETLTVMENILLPAMLYGGEANEEAATAVMVELGILGLKDARPAELSGGELRRMAICRALCHDPGIILADEPTGDLDDDNTRLVLEIFRRAAHEKGRTVLLVSHENEAVNYADRVLTCHAGKIAEAN